MQFLGRKWNDRKRFVET